MTPGFWPRFCYLSSSSTCQRMYRNISEVESSQCSLSKKGKDQGASKYVVKPQGWLCYCRGRTWMKSSKGVYKSLIDPGPGKSREPLSRSCQWLQKSLFDLLVLWPNFLSLVFSYLLFCPHHLIVGRFKGSFSAFSSMYVLLLGGLVLSMVSTAP